MTEDFETQGVDDADLDEREFLPAPGWPTPVGIVSLVMAGLGLFCGGVGLVMMPVMGNMLKSQLNGDPLPPTLVFGTADYAIGGVGLLCSVVLLAGGITLLGRRPVTRWLHLTYAGVAIPLNIWNMLRGFDKQAAATQWAQDFPNSPMAQQINAGGPGQMIGPAIGLCLGVVLGIGFPLFVIIWFGLIKTRPEQITGTVEGVY